MNPDGFDYNPDEFIASTAIDVFNAVLDIMRKNDCSPEEMGEVIPLFAVLYYGIHLSKDDFKKGLWSVSKYIELSATDEFYEGIKKISRTI